MGTDLAQFASNGALVTDVDLSGGHLQLAQENFRLRGLTGRFVHHDAESLPFDDDTLRSRLLERRASPHAEHAARRRRDPPRAEAGRPGDRHGLRRELAAVLAQSGLALRPEERRSGEPLDGRHHVAHRRADRQRRPPAREGLHETAAAGAVQRLRRHPDRAASDLAGARAPPAAAAAAGRRAAGRVEPDHQGPKAARARDASTRRPAARRAAARAARRAGAAGRRRRGDGPTSSRTPASPRTSGSARRLSRDALYVDLGDARIDAPAPATTRCSCRRRSTPRRASCATSSICSAADRTRRSIPIARPTPAATGRSTGISIRCPACASRAASRSREWNLEQMRPGRADIKLPWELARCQHWPLLGQAYRLTGDDRFALEIARELRDFMEANPIGTASTGPARWTSRCGRRTGRSASSWCGRARR